MIKVGMDRRQFLKTGALAAAGVALGETSVFAERVQARRKQFCPPDRKMRIAAVGCGGRGQGNIEGVSSEEIVALCDVDWERAKKVFEKFPDVPKFKDYRKMLREMGDKIDAVIVSTPDHMHYPVAMMAMEMGKHVYVEKPMAHTVWEARKMAEAARKYGVVTQMGNQGHAGEGIRLVKEWIQAGVIGKVREVHVWTNRPIWPQNLQRPKEEHPVPETLDWNLWLGVAPWRPYNKCYVPFNWRGWWDFGCGALGDMGCHTMDASFWALDLKAPISVEAEFEGGNEETGPIWSIVTYKFAARGDMPPVTLKWYDGGKLPPRPKELEPDRKMSKSGQLIIGDNGTIMDTTDYCNSPRLIPESRMKDFKRPPKTIPRVPDSSAHKEWIRACKGGPPCGSNFDYAGLLTETVLLGNVAIRAGRKFFWDGMNRWTISIAGHPEITKYLRKRYREF
ncbi:MAG: Gfo/Idh/MocA family oxidoreductase [Verrucomicrobiae bacterium]|nr:Gfo/Idh/MocA family oxidoreductase [Verrucomicrobiae bacterium]